MSPGGLPVSTSTPTNQLNKPMNKSQLKQLAESNWEPPDGGWGWLCVLACFTTYFMLVGMSRSFGIIYNDVERAFPGTKNSVIIMLPAMVITLTVGLGVVSGALTMAFSSRIVAFIGGVLSGVGLSLNYFATSVYYMFCCFIIAGIGAGLSTNPGVIIVAKYFRKRRTQAVGFSLAGTAIGSMLQPPLVKYLATTYGFRGALLIQGGLMFHVCAVALLYRDPVSQNALEKLAAKCAMETAMFSELYERGVQGRYRKTDTNMCFQWVERHLYVDLTLLCNPIFNIMMVSAMFLSVGYPQTLIIIPPHAESLGYSQYSGSILLSISAVGDLLGRLGSGFIFDKNIIKKQPGYIGTTLLISLSLIGMAFVQEYYTIAVGVFCYGAFAGCSYILLPVLLTEHHGAPKLSSSFGIVRTSMAVTCLTGPPLAGYLRDMTGDFKASILSIGAISSLASFVVLLIIPLKRRYRAQSQLKYPLSE